MIDIVRDMLWEEYICGVKISVKGVDGFNIISIFVMGLDKVNIFFK